MCGQRTDLDGKIVDSAGAVVLEAVVRPAAAALDINPGSAVVTHVASVSWE